MGKIKTIALNLTCLFAVCGAAWWVTFALTTAISSNAIPVVHAQYAPPIGAGGGSIQTGTVGANAVYTGANTLGPSTANIYVGLVNQTADIGSTTFATCSATTYCTYLIGGSLNCNVNNAGTATGTLTQAIAWTSPSSSNGTVAGSVNFGVLVFGTCAVQSATARLIQAAPGTTLTYSTTGTIVGSFNYDLSVMATLIGTE